VVCPPQIPPRLRPGAGPKADDPTAAYQAKKAALNGAWKAGGGQVNALAMSDPNAHEWRLGAL
jgi:hypothetical protein